MSTRIYGGPSKNLREIRCRFLNQLPLVKADEISGTGFGGLGALEISKAPEEEVRFDL